MLKLLKNEMKRVANIKLVVIFALCISIIFLITGAIIFGLGTDDKISSVLNRSNLNFSKSSDKWDGWALVALQFSIIFNKAAYLIVEGVLIANIFISEFKNKTILQLFSYPIKKERILWSKIIIILATTLVLSVLSQGIMIILIKCIAISTGYSFNIELNELLRLIISLVGTTFIGLIPVSIGMIKNSSVTTIISSLVIVVFICNAFPGTVVSNLISSIPMTLIMIFLGILACYFTIIRSTKKVI
jgi:ABC-type transport system involved in multi-copper enzyme maturation permease subunit